MSLPQQKEGPHRLFEDLLKKGFLIKNDVSDHQKSKTSRGDEKQRKELGTTSLMVHHCNKNPLIN